MTSSINFSSRLRKARAPVPFCIAWAANSRKASGVNSSSTPSMASSLLYCLISAFLVSVRIETNWSSVSSSSTVVIGSRPTNSGMKPKAIKSSGSTNCSTLSRSIAAEPLPLFDRAKSHDPIAQAALDDFFQADKRAAANKQNAAGIDPDIFLLRMLAPSLRRDIANGPFQNFQQRLLHAFAGNIACDGNIFRLARDLVDLVNVNDAHLGAFDVVVRVLQQAQNNILHVFADVARFGQSGGVGDGERNVEDFGQGAGQQRLARTGRANQQNVALFDLDLCMPGRVQFVRAPRELGAAVPG